MFVRLSFTLIYALLILAISSARYFKLNDEEDGKNSLAANDGIPGEHCVCVPYWQCKDDFSGLVSDGVDILDVRVIRNYNKAPAPCTGDFDVCCEVECGRSVPKNSPMELRILGENNEATFGEFPWMLGILKDTVYQCGASLIHPKVALTAAHCVQDKGSYKIRAGEYDWQKTDEPLSYQDRTVAKTIIHPDYNEGSLRNDIAILILNAAFKLSENVGVVCLPRPNATFNGKRCTASGWGKNSFEKGSYQSTLKKVQLPIVSNSQCLYTLQNERLGPYFQLHRSFICAGGENKKDTCKGDGGSPLVCPISDSGRFEQAGIVSWGLTCGVKNTPGVYVNIALFTEWIDEEVLKIGLDHNIYKI